MKQFAFRLAPVLRYRKHVEQTALMELAGAKRSLFDAIQTMKALQYAREQGAVALRNEEAGGMDVARHRIFSAYLRGLNDRIAAQHDRLNEMKAMVGEKQKAFEAERIKRESLELLKQKKRARYLQELSLAEQKAADELTGLRWRTKHSFQQP
jgi:flagellar export protein FliJ